MNISILGATGSIGRQTIEVAREQNIGIKALAAGSDYEGLAELAGQAEILALYDKDAAHKLQKLLPNTRVVAGMDGLIECASISGADIVVNSIVGSIGLKPTLAAISAKKDVALANKETLVAAGSIVMATAKANDVQILPIDSEHSAIWQCLQDIENINNVKRLILTASGGSFLGWEKEKIAKATAADAMHHPIWKMGGKITIDCATLMNKGLEYIEARWLFDMPYEKIDILIHPQSIIHSMVEFEDGAIMAQLATPDMRQPIQYALAKRKSRPHKPLDFLTLNALTFQEPDLARFPCLSLAIEAAKTGGTAPAMMNALNELLVEAFLKGAIGFYDISRLIEEALGAYSVKSVSSITDVEEAELWAGEFFEREVACLF